MSRSPNVTSLVAGLALIVLGALVVMDADGSLDLGFAYMGPALVAVLGVILLASGLVARARRQD
ncbi:MAG TPA: hypothetical protein VHQ43_06815 [Solirubrobacterales bacterium]|jgi:hypothetical protein|nr:hypothetical protein [Solirubrobacterales bacterium]